MPELADRIPGEIILASYNNDQRDRLVQRYVDATARSVATPLPVPGDTSYLTSTGIFSIFNGAVWIDYERVIDAAATNETQDKRLDLIENKTYTKLTQTGPNLNTSQSNVAQVIAAADGDYLCHFSGFVDYEIAITGGLSTPPLTAQWRKNDSLILDIGQIGSGGDGHSSANISHTYPMTAENLDGVLAGDEIQFYMATNSTSVLNPRLIDFMMWIEQVPLGKFSPEF